MAERAFSRNICNISIYVLHVCEAAYRLRLFRGPSLINSVPHHNSLPFSKKKKKKKEKKIVSSFLYEHFDGTLPVKGTRIKKIYIYAVIVIKIEGAEY